MAEEGLLPDPAIVSTARRAQETWERARPAFEVEILQHNERRIYEAPASAILGVIKETGSGPVRCCWSGTIPAFRNWPSS